MVRLVSATASTCHLLGLVEDIKHKIRISISRNIDADGETSNFVAYEVHSITGGRTETKRSYSLKGKEIDYRKSDHQEFLWLSSYDAFYIYAMLDRIKVFQGRLLDQRG